MNPMQHDFSTSYRKAPPVRSTFDRTSTSKTTLQEGDLVPFFVDEVLPGDTFSIKTSALLRQVTPLFPVMGDSYVDVYFFYVPSRILWSHWEELCGTNKSTPWDDNVDWVLPRLDGSLSVGDVGDYLGYPLEVEYGEVERSYNFLPVVAFWKIYDDWFRDENLISPNSGLVTFFNASSGAVVESRDLFDVHVPKVGKFHDYFTSCLPAPQKGSPVSLPLGTSADVKGTGVVQFGGTGDWASDTNLQALNGNSSGHASTLSLKVGSAANVYGEVLPGSFHADLANATASNVNDLRLAFQTQKLLERDARGGTRYVELLNEHFGVRGSDSRLQRPEYLGGFHQRLNMSQVEQTAPAAGSNVGNLGAYSVTGVSSDGYFSKSFEEHGYIIGVCCIRVKHSYSQGMPRWAMRTRRFEFYWPEFANIGEQPVYKDELWFNDDPGAVFGYQEAWADYRYKPDTATALMRTDVTGSLGASWTYGDLYVNTPNLSKAFVEEDASIMNRTVSVTSTNANPVMFKADFLISNKCTRPMPLYSIPGAIDHN